MIVIAGDIGGTNSRLAIYDGRRPTFERTYPSAEHTSLEAVVSRFLADAAPALGGPRPTHACIGVAGPVKDGISRVTNLPWLIDARKVEKETGLTRVTLLNDFEAAAHGVPALDVDEVVQIGGGPRDLRGPIVVLGAGTGLGQAFLFWSEAHGRYQVVPSEGGHADFAARNALEVGLLEFLTDKYGRVSYERILSGPGLHDLFAFLAADPALAPLVRPETREAMKKEEPQVVVVRQANEGQDPVCAAAVNLFSSVLGAHCGSLALTFLATGGVFIAGGVSPRVRAFLENGTFRGAFEAKGRFRPLVASVPAYLVVNKELGLLGAALHAAYS